MGSEGVCKEILRPSKLGFPEDILIRKLFNHNKYWFVAEIPIDIFGEIHIAKKIAVEQLRLIECGSSLEKSFMLVEDMYSSELTSCVTENKIGYCSNDLISMVQSEEDLVLEETLIKMLNL